MPLTLAVPPLHVALELDFTTVAATSPLSRFTSASVDCDWLLLPLPEGELLRASAEAIAATLALATDVLRLPPLDGSGPVSASATETPRALAFKATASPLNVVAPCALTDSGANSQNCCQTDCDPHRTFSLGRGINKPTRARDVCSGEG